MTAWSHAVPSGWRARVHEKLQDLVADPSCGAHLTGETFDDGTPLGSLPFGFHRRSGPSPGRPFTGPQGGNKGVGFYYYAESSGSVPNDRFALTYTGSACVGGKVATIAFWYHMYAARSGASEKSMGSLRVVATDGRTEEDAGDAGSTVWSTFEAKSDQWNFAAVTVDAIALRLTKLAPCKRSTNKSCIL